MSGTGADTKPTPVPTPKVTAATAAIAIVGLTGALIEWLVPTDIPATVEVPAETLAVFAAGWLAAREWKRGRHAR